MTGCQPSKESRGREEGFTMVKGPCHPWMLREGALSWFGFTSCRLSGDPGERRVSICFSGFSGLFLGFSLSYFVYCFSLFLEVASSLRISLSPFLSPSSFYPPQSFPPSSLSASSHPPTSLLLPASGCSRSCFVTVSLSPSPLCSWSLFFHQVYLCLAV